MKSSTPNIMVYGETGTFPIKLDIYRRMISFWTKLTDLESNKLSSYMYTIMYSHYLFSPNTGQNKFLWLKKIKNILIECGFSGIWDNQSYPNAKWLITATKQKLHDLFLNTWYENIQNSSSSYNYRIFKKSFGFENYLTQLPFKLRKFMIKFRTRNNKLPVEIGRWNKVPLNQRLCKLCSTDIGDEFHYLLNCKSIHEIRKKYLKRYYYTNPNILKFESIMNTKNKTEIRKICSFIGEILLLVE